MEDKGLIIIRKREEKEAEERLYFEELAERYLRSFPEDFSMEGNFNRENKEIARLAIMAVAAAKAAGKNSALFAEKSKSLSEKLSEGEFVSWKRRVYDLLYHHDEWMVLAHRLPMGEPPESWVSLVGTRSEGFRPGGGSQYGRRFYYSLAISSTLEVVAKYGHSKRENLDEISAWGVRERNGLGSFEAVAEKLGLTKTPHPYGYLYLDGDRPVAVHQAPEHWSTSYAVLGDLEFFHERGLVVLMKEESLTPRGRRENFSCSKEVVLPRQDIKNLREEGWYPISVFRNFVVWGTGLFLCPQGIGWSTHLDPARGRENDSRGTRIFDSSQKRMERVELFFLERVGCRVAYPEDEYIRWANGEKLEAYSAEGCLNGYNRYDYKSEWYPDFRGSDLSQFGEIECRWKRPREGAGRFYGVVR